MIRIPSQDSSPSKAVAFVVLGIALISIAASPAVSSANAAPPAQTDVMLLFDTSESMKPALKEASAALEEAIDQIDSQLPDVRYGLSEVRDYGGAVYDPKHPEDRPWQLDMPLTGDREAVISSIRGLDASGGGDPPEAYGRALWEAVGNPTIGWRPGANHLVVLVADSVPHDNNLDQGIPGSVWIEPSPWDTGNELHDPAGVIGTLLSEGTDLDWQSVLQKLAGGNIPLEVITYHSETGILPYWENWAAQTDGQAVPAERGQLADEIAGLVEAGAGQRCKQVHGGTGKLLLASLRCPAALPPLKAICDAKVSIAKPLKSLAKGQILVHKVRKGLGPLADLLSAARAAKFLRHAPRGFTTSDEVIRKLARSHTAIELIQVLPYLARAVQRPSFRRIAHDIADLAGAKACATGLITAVK
jgi:hypothetical protein